MRGNGVATSSARDFEVVSIDVLNKLRASRDDQIAELQRRNDALEAWAMEMSRHVNELRRTIAAMSAIAQAARAYRTPPAPSSPDLRSS